MLAKALIATPQQITDKPPEIQSPLPPYTHLPKQQKLKEREKLSNFSFPDCANLKQESGAAEMEAVVCNMPLLSILWGPSPLPRLTRFINDNGDIIAHKHLSVFKLSVFDVRIVSCNRKLLDALASPD